MIDIYLYLSRLIATVNLMPRLDDKFQDVRV